MKKTINDIREFFWPLLEVDPGNANAAESAAPIELDIAEDTLEEAYKLLIKLNENEDDRRKSIESKAALFISTISIATSLILAANAIVSDNGLITNAIRLSILLSFILSIYATRTVWFSIKALQRGSFAVLHFEDLNKPDGKSDFYRNIIRKLYENMKYNQDTINAKVDYFTMAQEYYKRALVTICLYSFYVLITSLIYSKNMDSSKTTQLNQINIVTKTSKDSSKSQPPPVPANNNKGDSVMKAQEAGSR